MLAAVFPQAAAILTPQHFPGTPWVECWGVPFSRPNGAIALTTAATWVCTGGVLTLWNTAQIAAATGHPPVRIRLWAGTHNPDGALFPAPVAAIGEHHGWLPGQADHIAAWLAGQPCPEPPALTVYLPTAVVADLVGMTIKAVQMTVWRQARIARPDPFPAPDARIERRNGFAEALGWLPGRRADLRRWRHPVPVVEAPAGPVIEVVGLSHLARVLGVQPRTVADWYATHVGTGPDPFPSPDVVTTGSENVAKPQPGWRPERVELVVAWRARLRAHARTAGTTRPGQPDPVLVWLAQGRSLRDVAALSGLSVRTVRMRRLAAGGTSSW